MLNINEIFYSIMGEGHNVGTAMVFIRLQGCNMEPKCEWCDTKYSQNHNTKNKLQEYEILEYVDKISGDCNIVCITGGEPLMQNIYNLLCILKHNGYSTCVETNGTIKINEELRKWIDWLTVSPKNNKNKQREGEEIKIVWTGRQRLNQFEKQKFKHYYIQPCTEQKDIWEYNPIRLNKRIKEVIDIIKKRPKWKLSLQIHKIIGIR